MVSGLFDDKRSSPAGDAKVWVVYWRLPANPYLGMILEFFYMYNPSIRSYATRVHTFVLLHTIGASHYPRSGGF